MDLDFEHTNLPFWVLCRMTEIIQAQKLVQERDQVLRAAWISTITNYEINHLMCLNESAANKRTSGQKFGWAPIGVTSHLH